MTRHLHEHLFLTALAVVLLAGTLTLVASWLIGVAVDGWEDWRAEREGAFDDAPDE